MFAVRRLRGAAASARPLSTLPRSTLPAAAPLVPDSLEDRRRQLRETLAAPAAVPAKIIVVGGGRMGDIRCSHIARSATAQLTAFVDSTPQSAAKFARHYGCDAFVSLDDALEKHPDAQGIWVCVPSPHHPEVILKAAARGMHVAVEKPVAMSVSEINACYSACADAGVSLLCAFQRRSDAGYSAMAAAVKAGDVGAPRSIRTVFRDHPTPTKAFLLQGGGDPFHDLATHDIDFILDLLEGEIPDEVYAIGSSSDAELGAAGIHDAATIVLRWGDSLVATMEVARASNYGYDQRCEVYGSNGGSLQVDNVLSTPLSSRGSAGVNQGAYSYSFPQRFEAAFGVEVQQFVDCIQGRGAPRVLQRDAALATYLAEAALQSALTQRPIILDKAAVAAAVRA
ncbi:hypothetical protein M885DRAFT_484756 [Pelagophyceae sp. CCMP2097]|nr:hypothetical protein M885DRAFT_484756 [Pelagophyceae sp. CCMP2097]